MDTREFFTVSIKNGKTRIKGDAEIKGDLAMIISDSVDIYQRERGTFMIPIVKIPAKLSVIESKRLCECWDFFKYIPCPYFEGCVLERYCIRRLNRT